MVSAAQVCLGKQLITHGQAVIVPGSILSPSISAKKGFSWAAVYTLIGMGRGHWKCCAFADTGAGIPVPGVQTELPQKEYQILALNAALKFPRPIIKLLEGLSEALQIGEWIFALDRKTGENVSFQCPATVPGKSEQVAVMGEQSGYKVIDQVPSAWHHRVTIASSLHPMT